MDRKAWHAASHGVAKSRTRLSNWTELNFSFCLQSFPASGSFPMSWLFTSGGQNIKASASPPNLSNNFVSTKPPERGPIWIHSQCLFDIEVSLYTVKFSHFPGVHTYKCSQNNYSQGIKYFHPSSKSSMVPLWLIPLTPGNYWTDNFPLSNMSYKWNYIVWPKSSFRFISVKCHSTINNKLNHANPLLKTFWRFLSEWNTHSSAEFTDPTAVG